MKYRIHIAQDEDGMFIAECPSLPGCISQGVTRSDSIVHIQEAIECYPESLRKHNEPIPPWIEGEITQSERVYPPKFSILIA